MEATPQALGSPGFSGRIRRCAAVSGRVILGTAFFLAAGLKVSQPPLGARGPAGIDASAEILKAQGIPSGMAAPVAWLTVVVEIGVAVFLFVAWRRARLAAGLGLALLGVFSVYLVVVHWRGPDASCGCFGEAVMPNLAANLARNCALAAALLPTLLCRFQEHGWSC